MKFLLALVLTVLALMTNSTTGLAQGHIWFVNDAATTITDETTASPWWGPQPGLLRVAVYGAAGAGQLESSLLLQMNAVTNLNAPGRFFGGTRFLDLVPGQVTLQIRAWGASSPYETYEDAVTAALGGDGSVVLGTSLPFSAVLTAPLNPPTPIATQGLQPFQVRPVPEPSMWTFGALALCTLLFMRFARQSSRPK